MEPELHTRIRPGLGYIAGFGHLPNGQSMIVCREGVCLTNRDGQILQAWPWSSDVRIAEGVVATSHYLILPTQKGLVFWSWETSQIVYHTAPARARRIYRGPTNILAVLYQEHGVVFYQLHDVTSPPGCLSIIRVCPVHYFGSMGAWSLDGEVFVYSSPTDIVLFAQPYHPRTRTWLQRPSKHQERPVPRSTITVGPYKQVATGWSDGVVDIFEPAVLSTTKPHIVQRVERDSTLDMAITSLCWPHEHLLVAGLQDGRMAWRHPKRPGWRYIRPHNGPIRILEYHDSQMWSAGLDGMLCIWQWPEPSTAPKTPADPEEPAGVQHQSEITTHPTESVAQSAV